VVTKYEQEKEKKTSQDTLAARRG